MKVVLGSDSAGKELKNYLKNELQSNDLEIVDVTGDEDLNFVDSTKKVIDEIDKDEDNLGIVIDAYGAGSFITATKHKGVIAAEVSDEHSALMTRRHNNARIITLGSEIVGKELAKNISLAFAKTDYDGGRHQVRVDMLNAMC